MTQYLVLAGRRGFQQDHQPQANANLKFLIILAWQRNTSILLKTRHCWTRDSTYSSCRFPGDSKMDSRTIPATAGQVRRDGWNPSLFADYRLRSARRCSGVSAAQAIGVSIAIKTSAPAWGQWTPSISEETNRCRRRRRNSWSQKRGLRLKLMGGIFC